MSRPTLTFSPERYAVLHKLISLGLDALPDNECTEDVLSSVTWFSSVGALYPEYKNYDPSVPVDKLTQTSAQRLQNDL
jgi:hypothetical protein